MRMPQSVRVQFGKEEQEQEKPCRGIECFAEAFKQREMNGIRDDQHQEQWLEQESVPALRASVCVGQRNGGATRLEPMSHRYSRRLQETKSSTPRITSRHTTTARSRFMRRTSLASATV